MCTFKSRALLCITCCHACALRSGGCVCMRIWAHVPLQFSLSPSVSQCPSASVLLADTIWEWVRERERKERTVDDQWGRWFICIHEREREQEEEESALLYFDLFELLESNASSWYYKLKLPMFSFLCQHLISQIWLLSSQMQVPSRAERSHRIRVERAVRVYLPKKNKTKQKTQNKKPSDKNVMLS